jgi:hypothetical protein
MVLSQTTLVTTRWKVVASEPSWEVQASRFGRNATPSGVVIVSGTSTDTQATAPGLEQPGGADGQVVVKERGDGAEQPLAVLVDDVSVGEQPEDRAAVLVTERSGRTDDRLPTAVGQPDEPVLGVVLGEPGGPLPL